MKTIQGSFLCACENAGGLGETWETQKTENWCFREESSIQMLY